MKDTAALIVMIGIASAVLVGVADCTDNTSESCNGLDTVSVTLDPLDNLDQDVQKRDPKNVHRLFSESRPGSRPLNRIGKSFGQDDAADTEQVRSQRDLNDDLDKRDDKKPDDKKQEDSNKSIPNTGSKDKGGPGKKLQNAIWKDTKKSAANMAVAQSGMQGYLSVGLAVIVVVAGLDVVAF
ncbi:uncharacterized protein B0T15DRAFT_493368 [Chaetomium strumarium]|uniref:Uncharacterized protein n=1 Tax=Chaetomium strumarium TaxID=1170767 RepID=A0AAJ0GSM7_9PEZI|nr:hypothetical protein B0T15DRAFT_493368 [Chaetomium strumarium]